MKTEFKLVGLSRSMIVTCETDKENTFRPKVNMSQERFDALFNYCKNNWKDKKIAVIEHDGYYGDIPKDPVLIEIKEL